MSEKANKNLEIARRYVDLYNTDPERFVRECYHTDYKVGAMGLGWYDGIEKFIEVEKSVLRAAPQRKMRVDRMHATDEAVVVEAAVVDPARGPDWELPFCAVLEIRGDKIAVDRTYADYHDWPGLEGIG
ncbi:MAG: nuclear transport factor 2 family protein [Gammaproteobacteria bacterium]